MIIMMPGPVIVAQFPITPCRPLPTLLHPPHLVTLHHVCTILTSSTPSIILGLSALPARGRGGAVGLGSWLTGKPASPAVAVLHKVALVQSSKGAG